MENEVEDTGFYSMTQGMVRWELQELLQKYFDDNYISGMWWAVQTLTSLGYGDFPVETIPGKLHSHDF